MTVNKKVLLKVISGLSDKNVRFSDLKKILVDLGFEERIKRSHHIFYHRAVVEIINLQPLPDGNAKPYQVKQVRNILLKYRLHNGV